MKEDLIIKILFALVIRIPVIVLWFNFSATRNKHKSTEIRDKAFTETFYK